MKINICDDVYINKNIRIINCVSHIIISYFSLKFPSRRQKSYLIRPLLRHQPEAMWYVPVTVIE